MTIILHWRIIYLSINITKTTIQATIVNLKLIVVTSPITTMTLTYGYTYNDWNQDNQ